MSVARRNFINRFAPVFPVEARSRPPRKSAQSLAFMLMKEGLVQPHEIMQLLEPHQDGQRHLADILIVREVLDTETLYQAMARHWGVGRADLHTIPPDPRMIRALNHVAALRDGFLPWRMVGGATVIATAYPDLFHLQKARLEEIYGSVAMAVAPLVEIEAAILQLRGKELAHASENRVDARESCRKFKSTGLRRGAVGLAAVMTVLGAIQPLALMFAVFGLAILAMLSSNMMKLIALILMQRRTPEPEDFATIAHLPVVSVMVALYREATIAPRLAARLSKIDYPRELLDILLVVEAEDALTRNALARTELPGWMRVVVVPDGSVKTKPRALNYALDHCRGSIVGVYDAEDAPEPDQIQKVVERFHRCGSEVVCLQGILDYYNPRTNWLARCFTIEYASWFRMFLPGIARMGLAIPLGGTTLFFRRQALEELGAWDAQNVTEDADLGLRIFRHGMRTELIETTTYEEANCRAVPWIKQRSRWIKGYMMTWITHMRAPRLLWQQLGPRRFIGFQVQFMGSVVQTLLAPVFWSFWLIPLGFQHPLVTALPASAFVVLYVSMFAITALTIGFDILGLRKTRHKLNPLWAATLVAYHPLAAFAAYKALWELLTKPFYWDKTSHGHFDF